MRILFLIILSSVSCLAQFGVEQPFFASRSVAAKTGPESIPGLSLYWTAEDLATNTEVLSWVDRIQGSIWTNGASARRPTNTSSGVFFLSSSQQYLTNSGANIGGGTIQKTNTHWMVVKYLDIDSSYDLMYSTDNPYNEFGSIDNVPPGRLHFGTYPDKVAYVGGNFLNRYIDLCSVGNSNYASVVFTNAISPVNGTNAAVGAIDGNTVYKYLGRRYDNNNHFKGYVFEIAIWTNQLTLAQIQDLHKYATNKYGFSP